MSKSYLSQYFRGVAAKKLSAVEADDLTSNQHEFNGVGDLKRILGAPDGKNRYPTKFIYLTDQEDPPLEEEGSLTWYDARQRAREERGVDRSEYRLYFPTNQVTQLASSGDTLVIAQLPDETLLAIVAEDETTIEHQIRWLFGFPDDIHPGFSVRDELEAEQDRIAYTSRFILEAIGVRTEISEDGFLDEMLNLFGASFPTTRIFSSYARNTLPDVNPADGQDAALMAWMEREEVLFRTLEKHLIAERLQFGFDGDVDGFISFSLSVQNRRKSRAGLALENHLEILFRECGIRNSRTPKTENKSKPDFIFPGELEYHDPGFQSDGLTMLGVKSSCKERWRQVLPEANRIPHKHLLTLEAAISENQTEQMKAMNLQLVVPQEIQCSYTIGQRNWLIGVSDFIKYVGDKQSSDLRGQMDLC